MQCAVETGKGKRKIRMDWKRKEHLKRETAPERMQIVTKGEVVYLTFPILDRTKLVKHGFSTRIGGVSEGMFSSMNLSFSRGDREEHVRENFRRMASALETDTECMVFSDQTHTTNVRIITQADRGKGIHSPLDYTDVDGLVTNERGVMLVTFYADCVPVFLVDTKHNAIGLCHSGWRGTVGKISQETLRVMKETYQTEAEDVIAAIGPSICQDCYEVSKDVILEVEKGFGREGMKELAYKKENGKYQLDLWRANEIALMQAGVPACRIQTTDICTCCNSRYLFSHRATAGRRGNLAAFLELK